jgi:hypothetical protein
MKMNAHERETHDDEATALAMSPAVSPAMSSVATDDKRDGDNESVAQPAPHDDARLLVQSPHRLYLYWSFARDPRVALRRAFGGLAERFAVGVRLIDLENGADVATAPAHVQSFWFDAAPARAYRAEVGFVADGFPFVRALTSNTVETPSDTISRATDDDEAFRIGARDFARLLSTSGFADLARAANATGEREMGDDEITPYKSASDEEIAAVASLRVASSSSSQHAAPSSLSLLARAR